MMQTGSGNGKSRRWVKILAAVLLSILLVCLLALAVAAVCWNTLLNQIGSSAETVTIPLETTESGTVASEMTEPETAPEETWPSIRSDQTITNILLIGENNNLADSMILCSIHRENKTLSLVSFLRDLYVPIPAYAGHGADRNRINACYFWGSKWTGKPEGGMVLLSACIEQNFGIPVDHCVAVDFEIFTQVIDALGGVEIDLTEREANYLSRHVGYVGEFVPGLQTLTGLEALAYSRIRKIDSDIQRTQRQRNVLTALMSKCQNLGLLQMKDLAMTVLPLITTNMTKQEITAYVWELLPMLQDLEVHSITCPVDNITLPNSRWDQQVEIGGIPCAVIACSIRRNRDYLAEFLDLPEA